MVDRNLEPFTMLERDGGKVRVPKEKLADAVKDDAGKALLDGTYERL
jgi:hypothetical protein